MPKYERAADLRARLADPIAFELAGRTFANVRVPPGTFRRVMQLRGTENANADILKVIIGEAAFAEIETKLDERELIPLVIWLIDTISAGLGDEEKNSEETSPESPEPSRDSSDTATS